MPDKPTTVSEYLQSLPAERREALQAIRTVIRDNLDSDYAEGIQYGMIGYYVPHSVYPAGYHADPAQPLPFASLASQKRHMAVYLCSVYSSEDEQRWFRHAWAATGTTLDMGKSCVRFRTLDGAALDVIGESIRRWPARAFIAHYESVQGSRTRPARRPARRTAPRAAAPRR